MKQKKIITALLAAAIAISLTACGEAQETQKTDSAEDSKTQSEDMDKNKADVENENDDKSSGVQMEGLKTTANIGETVLIDENNIKVIATDLEYTDYSVDLNLKIENNSDKDLSFISGSVGYSCNSVNGYMVDSAYLSADIAAGKKSNESISFSMDELAMYGLTEVADMQIGFDIKDENYESVYCGIGQIKTSAADSYDYSADTYCESVNSGVLERVYGCAIDYFSQDELYNQNDVRITSEALMTNKDGEKAVLVEIQNDSQEQVYGVAANISVNGLVLYSSMWSGDLINPGTRRVMDLSISSMVDESCMEAFGISDIGDFTFSFVTKDADFDDITESQEISIAISDGAAVDDTGVELYNENGIRIISKGLIESESDYYDDIHMLFLVENNYSDTICVDGSYGTLSLNGYMTDFIADSINVDSGKYAAIDVNIQASSLEDNDIAVEDITEAEITFEINDEDYNMIAEPTVSIDY